MKITKRQLRRIIKEEKLKLVQEARPRLEPDGKWWSLAFEDVISDYLDGQEPTPEQKSAIINGLQRAMNNMEL